MTRLTRARWAEVLALAGVTRAFAVCLQETKHPTGGYRWAEAMANAAGFRMQWSPNAGVDTLGRARCGGTALAWRVTAEKSEEQKSTSQAATGRAWAHMALWSIYGPASATDVDWAASNFDNAERCRGRPRLLFGDWNWKEAYAQTLPSDWLARGGLAADGAGRNGETNALGCGRLQGGQCRGRCRAGRAPPQGGCGRVVSGPPRGGKALEGEKGGQLRVVHGPQPEGKGGHLARSREGGAPPFLGGAAWRCVAGLARARGGGLQASG